jgi:uncharacterized membrane protein HdeD (DUF308 family)
MYVMSWGGIELMSLCKPHSKEPITTVIMSLVGLPICGVFAIKASLTAHDRLFLIIGISAFVTGMIHWCELLFSVRKQNRISELLQWTRTVTWLVFLSTFAIFVFNRGISLHHVIDKLLGILLSITSIFLWWSLGHQLVNESRQKR